MNREHKLHIDINKSRYVPVITFSQCDKNVNDIYIDITKNGSVVDDLDKTIIILATIKPSGFSQAQFLDVVNGRAYADLEDNLTNEIGLYKAKLMLVLDNEVVTSDVFTYEVKEDSIVSSLGKDVVSTNEFSLLTDMISRLSNLELNEISREERFAIIQSEFDIMKSSFENIVTRETIKRVDETIKPLVDNKVNDLVTKPLQDIDNALVNVGSKLVEVDDSMELVSSKVTNKLSEVDVAISKIPPKEELIGPRGPQGLTGLQGSQGPQGPKGDVGPQGLQGVRGVKGDVGAIGPRGLQGIKGDRGDTGIQGPKGDTPSIVHLEASISNKIKEVDTRFNQLTSQQQQDSEVVDARLGFGSLREKLEALEKSPNIIYETVEG